MSRDLNIRTREGCEFLCEVPEGYRPSFYTDQHGTSIIATSPEHPPIIFKDDKWEEIHHAKET